MNFFSTEERINRYGYYLMVLAALASVPFETIIHNCTYLALALGLIRYYKFKDSVKLDFAMKFGMIAFFLGLLVSSSFAPNRPTGYHETYIFFKIMLPFWAAYLFISNQRQLSRVVTALAISISIPAIYAIFQGINGNVRANAFLGHYNAFACFLDIYIPLLYVAAFENNFLSKMARRVTGAVLIIAILALIYNGTRGAWLAIGLTFMAYILIKIKDNRKLGICLLIAFIILSVSLLQSNRINSRLSTIFDPQFTSNSERVLMWESALAMWRDYPLTGVGLSNFKIMEREKYISPLHKEPVTNHVHAHSIFFNFLAETGLIGISGFFILFASIFYQTVRNIKNPAMKAAFLITSTLLLHGLVDYSFTYRAAIQAYWFILGVMFGGSKIIFERKPYLPE